jgi:hypothetical protein
MKAPAGSVFKGVEIFTREEIPACVALVLTHGFALPYVSLPEKTKPALVVLRKAGRH